MKWSLRTLASATALIVICSLLVLADAEAAGRRQPGTARGPNKVHTHRLANGMTVLVEQDYRAPQASFTLWYGVGSRDDPPGKAGATGATTGMMTKATTHVPDGAYTEILSRAGARDTGDTVYRDYTVLRTTVPSNRIALPMWLWSDQMGFFVPAATEAGLHRQKEAMRVEWKHKTESASAQALFNTAVSEVFSPTHPYYRNSLPAPFEFDPLQLADILAHHQRWFVPNNAVLAVSGLVEPKAVFELADKYFGPIPSGPPTTRPSSQPASLVDDILLEAEAPIPRPEIAMYWPSPGIEEPGDYELDVLAGILSGEMVSWLTWRLVDKQKVADAAWARQTSDDLASFFRVYAKVSQGHSPEEVISALDGIISSASDPAELKELEVRRAANEIIIRDMFYFQRPSGRIARYAVCQWRYGDPDCLLWRVNRLNEIKPEDVHKAAAALKSSGRVIVTIRPNASAPVSGRVVSRQVRKHP